MLGRGPLPALDDVEGPRVPASAPPIIDAHVHLFPDRLFEAVWSWFDKYGWEIRYKLHTPKVIEFLFSRGVEAIVALHYAHKPGMARALNAYIAELARTDPRIIGMATVFPGEDGAVQILEEAFAAGLRGVKLHCHVQCFAPDADAMREVYETCARHGKVVVMHAGREPSSPHYKCDPHALCSVDRVGAVLAEHPKLKLCIPHLGADEFSPYGGLLERFDNLWLDTTMAIGDYLGNWNARDFLRIRPDRIMYGTDFPNIPYAWDRELNKLLGMKLGDDATERICGGTAAALFGIARSGPSNFQLMNTPLR